MHDAAALAEPASARRGIPFDTETLDRLMEEAGFDALAITSKHSIQYFFGGYRYFFYGAMDAHGLSRYLPVIVYIKGRPDRAAYLGNPMEAMEAELGKFWTPETQFRHWTSPDAARSALAYIDKAAPRGARIGVEMGFLPADAFKILSEGLGHNRLGDATLTLEMLRAVKTPAELDKVRQASEKVVEAMLATFAAAQEGVSKLDLNERLKREERARGLEFDYCLMTMGTSLNRSPSDQRLRKGEIMSLDSGGNQDGYIGDLCRMGILGEPDAELDDLLAEVDAIQQAARTPIRAGARGGEIFAGAEAMLEGSAHRAHIHFAAHGMGLVGHEAPWLSDRMTPPYPAYHADRPLDAGMVVSIETTLRHPARGFVKLEDTVAVTATGWGAFGDTGRGWNRMG